MLPNLPVALWQRHSMSVLPGDNLLDCKVCQVSKHIYLSRRSACIHCQNGKLQLMSYLACRMAKQSSKWRILKLRQKRKSRKARELPGQLACTSRATLPLNSVCMGMEICHAETQSKAEISAVSAAASRFTYCLNAALCSAECEVVQDLSHEQHLKPSLRQHQHHNFLL